MPDIAVLMTCHNRKEKTRSCIETIYDDVYKIHFIVTDDGSTDGTSELLQQLKPDYHLSVLKGTGKLYWCGGMRKAISYVMQCGKTYDYYVFVNDDVIFRPEVLKQTIARSREKNNAVIVGAVCNFQGELTYGGIQYRGKGIRYDTVKPGDENLCDTFNCNYVLLPSVVFKKAGNLDSNYRHTMADFDYGLHIRRLGYPIYSSVNYVGICERNKRENTWSERTLPRIDRFKRKESIKGLPCREWFYFLKKNFGIVKAIWHSVTPYIKIIIGT